VGRLWQLRLGRSVRQGVDAGREGVKLVRVWREMRWVVGLLTFGR
jgi:hypothetical protein